ncbi:MAG: hypothetical protein ACHQ2Y_04325 [Candidatus Lutacidiplasmatales archaeon]
MGTEAETPLQGNTTPKTNAYRIAYDFTSGGTVIVIAQDEDHAVAAVRAQAETYGDLPEARNKGDLDVYEPDDLSIETGEDLDKTIEGADVPVLRDFGLGNSRWEEGRSPRDFD